MVYQLKENISHLFKDAMANYPSGVAIVTTLDNQHKPVGIAVNSFTSLSMNPLLVMWSISNTSSSYDIFKESKQFAVHLLSGEQAELVSIFSQKNINRFEQISWQLSEANLPILEGAYAVFTSVTYQVIEVGDHAIIIGAVDNIQTDMQTPLLYHQRRVGSLPQAFHTNI